jgi:hypothetical protein
MEDRWFTELGFLAPSSQSLVPLYISIHQWAKYPTRRESPYPVGEVRSANLKDVEVESRCEYKRDGDDYRNGTTKENCLGYN